MCGRYMCGKAVCGREIFAREDCTGEIGAREVIGRIDVVVDIAMDCIVGSVFEGTQYGTL